MDYPTMVLHQKLTEAKMMMRTGAPPALLQSTIGWTPSEAREGNEVVMMSGFQIQLVLRPCRLGCGKYSLVGVCYVYRHMDGQAHKDVDSWGSIYIS